MTPLPIIFTIEDLIGAVMPGMVWSIELYTLNELLREPVVQSTFQVAMTYSEKESPFFLGFLISSVILGYISNVFPTGVSEAISRPVHRMVMRMMGKGGGSGGDGEITSKDDVFPYLKFHKGQRYYDTVLEAVKLYYGRQWNELPGAPSNKGTEYEAFQQCKRILRWHASTYVWQKIQHLEAQTRMLSSLLLAAVFNFLLAVGGAIKTVTSHDPHVFFDICIWLISSSVFAIVLSYTFQYRRRTEVESIFSYTLLLLNSARVKEAARSQR